LNNAKEIGYKYEKMMSYRKWAINRMRQYRRRQRQRGGILLQG